MSPYSLLGQILAEEKKEADAIAREHEKRNILEKAAQHSLEWANIAGGAAFEIVLTAILAALTAGAGATVALAGKGKYLRKLGELLRDLAEPLKRLKRSWGKGSRGKGAGSGRKALVEEVDTPGYNEPLKGEATSVDNNVKPGNDTVGVSTGFELSPDDIAKLRANQFAHTLERHGPDITVDQLKRRATEGIAPDNSTIPKYQGGNRIGNVIPPLSSKFESAESLKSALDAVDTSSPAFANALAQAQSNLLPGQSLTRFKFEVDLGESVGFGYQRPSGTPNYVLAGQKLPGEPAKVANLSKVKQDIN